MKKEGNRRYLIGIFIVSLIMMIPMLFYYEYLGHDTVFHLANIDRIINQLSFSNWLVKEPLSLIANNFGYGTRFFYPPLPHLTAAYIGKFLSLFSINNSALIAMKITSWLTVFLSGITFYYLIEKLFKNKNISFLASIFYMSAPYHLADIFIRDAFSEMFMFISIPLILLGILEILDGNHKKFYFYFTLGYVLAIYSHLAMTIYFTLMVAVVFLLTSFKKIFTKKNVCYFLLSAASILMLTAPFWLPLLEMKMGDYAIFIPYYMTGKGEMIHSCLNILQYFYFFLSPSDGSIRHYLPLTITILIFISLYEFLKKHEWKDKTHLSIVLFFLLSFWMTTSAFPWQYAPDFLGTLQFPWRLTLYVQFSGIILAMYPLTKWTDKKYFTKIFYAFIVVCLIGSFYHTSHLETKVASTIDYNLGTGWQTEYLPANTLNHKEYYEQRSEEILVIEGSGTIRIKENDVPYLAFEVSDASELTVELPRLYYPGYILTHNDIEIELTESAYGFLEATITEEGLYELKYEGTGFFQLGYLLAFLSLCEQVALFIYFKKKKDNPKKKEVYLQ